jgi:hypothetical protein
MPGVRVAAISLQRLAGPRLSALLDPLLNRVQLETCSASLSKPPGGRRSDPKSTGLELDAV